MTKRSFFIAVLCIFIFASLVANGILIYVVVKGTQVSQQHQVNQKVLDFRNMFTQKVLLSNQEIDFDNRLALETAVRGLNDPAIFASWQAFTNCQTKESATAQAKALLELLIEKTSY